MTKKKYNETTRMILKAKFLKMTLRGFFLSFRNSFFHYYQVNLGAIWYLNKYKKINKKEEARVAHSLARVVHSLAHAAPLDIQKHSFIMSLEALSCPFTSGVMRVGCGCLVCRQRTFQLGPFCCWYFNSNTYSFDF